MHKQMAITRTEAAGFAAFGMIAAVVFAGAGPARADVKLVNELTLTGLEELGARGIPVKALRYFKNGMMRDEWEGGNYVHIYDSKNDKFYTLDRTTQTYSIQTLDDVTSSGSGPLSMVDVEGTSSIVEGGSVSKIAGKAAKNYTTNSLLILKAQRSGVKLLAVKIQGEQWTASNIAFPDANPRIIRAAFLLPTRVHKVFKPYYDKVGDMKGLPLSFDLILTVQGAPGAAVSGAGSQVVGGTFEAHSDVLSISTATLPEYLFHVPKTFKLVPHIVEKNNG